MDRLLTGKRGSRLVFGVLWGALPLAVSACAGGRQPARDELSPGIVFPTTLGEGDGDGALPPLPPPAASAPAAPSASSAPTVAPPSSPPDPEPLRMAEQWEYDLKWEAGKMYVLGVRPRRFASPVVSARRFGRFAIELWIGSELVERVRFDFAGLALEEPSKPGGRRPLYPPSDLGRGAEVQQTVLVPAAPRARKALLIDRATGEASELLWPPDQGVQTPPGTASATSPPATTSAPAPTPKAPGSAAPRVAAPGATQR